VGEVGWWGVGGVRLYRRFSSFSLKEANGYVEKIKRVRPLRTGLESTFSLPGKHIVVWMVFFNIVVSAHGADAAFFDNVLSDTGWRLRAFEC
jgi:hypothetical protein